MTAHSSSHTTPAFCGVYHRSLIIYMQCHNINYVFMNVTMQKNIGESIMAKHIVFLFFSISVWILAIYRIWIFWQQYNDLSCKWITVEASLYIGDQCLWILWVTLTHKVTLPWIYHNLIVLKFYATVNLPAKLSLNKPIKFWYSMNIGLHKWKWFHCITRNFFLRFRQNGNQMKNLCLINYIYDTKKPLFFFINTSII